MQFFSKYFVMKLLKSLLAPVFASVILSACTLDAERPTDVQHIDKNDITWQQHLKKIKQIQSYSTKGQIGYISPQERFSSRFEWQYQNPKAYKLKLYSMISKTTLTMETVSYTHLYEYSNRHVVRTIFLCVFQRFFCIENEFLDTCNDGIS